METYVAEYVSSNGLSAVKSPLRICPTDTNSDYHNGRVTGMTLDASVDMVYTPREDNYIQIQSLDFPNKKFCPYGHDLAHIPGSETYILRIVEDFLFEGN